MKKEESKIPRKLLKLFESKHAISSEVAATLESEDLKMLAKIATGQIPEANIHNRIKALSVLSHHGRAEDAALMSKIIGNEKEDIRVRVAAAVNLGYFPSAIAEEKLIERLRVGDDVLQAKVIKSLGMIGGIKAYKALTRLKGINTIFVQKQLALSTALIAYRLNIDADPIPYIEGAVREPETEYDSVRAHQISERPINDAMKLLEGSKYETELSSSIGFEISCGRARWILFINKLAAERGIVGSLIADRMIAGILARWIRETKTYSTQYIILSKPIENQRAQIMVVRSDGEIMYTGKAKVDNGKMSFALSDVKRAGTAPTKVTGKITAKEIEINVHIVSKRREEKRKVKTLEFQDLRDRFGDLSKID